MKVAIISDLHIGHYQYPKYEIESDADVLIVAGDLDCIDMVQYTRFFETNCAKYKNVIFVAGNHEYYRKTFVGFEFDMLNICDKFTNLHYLDRSDVTIDGQRFIGATLWFRETSKTIMCPFFSDYNYIMESSKSIDDLAVSHFDYLIENIRETDVVITHHAPSAKSIVPYYRDSEINDFFVHKNAELIIHTKNPKLWIHGHMHNPLDYTILDTRVVCNPNGYPHENNNVRRKPLVVEL